MIPRQQNLLRDCIFSIKMIRHNPFASQERFYECLECNEAITNPLCPVCLTTQIEAWLSQYPNIRKRLIPKLLDYIKKTKNLEEDTVRCIACNKKRASICPYCFTSFVFNLLREEKAHNTILKEFLQFFNFDLRREGYYRRAEESGIV